MRTCPFCLATNADGAPFCTSCGRAGPLAPGPPAPAPPMGGWQPAPPMGGWQPDEAVVVDGPGRGPLVLVLTSAAAALLLVLAAYLGSIAPAPPPALKQERIPSPSPLVSPGGDRGR